MAETERSDRLPSYEERQREVREMIEEADRQDDEPMGPDGLADALTEIADGWVKRALATPPDTDPSEWTDERYARGWGQDTDPHPVERRGDLLVCTSCGAVSREPDTDPSGLGDARWYVCPDCDGDGWNPSHDPEKPKQVQCERCVGTGRLQAAIQESRAGGGLDALVERARQVHASHDLGHQLGAWPKACALCEAFAAYAKDTVS